MDGSGSEGSGVDGSGVDGSGLDVKAVASSPLHERAVVVDHAVSVLEAARKGWEVDRVRGMGSDGAVKGEPVAACPLHRLVAAEQEGSRQ